jgi:hypothetical protein
MPALVGPLVGFSLGVLLAWLARGATARDDDRSLRARAQVAALFGALVFAPACAYFLAFSGDWARFYLIEGRAVPSALDLVLVVLDAAVVPLGFVAARRAGRTTAYGVIGALGGVPAAAALALLLIFFPELRVDGTYHQVRGDFGTQPVAFGPLGYAILWMDGMILAGFLVSARALERRAAPRAIDPARPDEGAYAAPTKHLGARRRR